MNWSIGYKPHEDTSVTVECKDCDITWHPAIYYEYRGVVPHGGHVAEYTTHAFDCPSCGKDCE